MKKLLTILTGSIFISSSFAQNNLLFTHYLTDTVVKIYHEKNCDNNNYNSLGIKSYKCMRDAAGVTNGAKI